MKYLVTLDVKTNNTEYSFAYIVENKNAKEAKEKVKELFESVHEKHPFHLKANKITNTLNFVENKMYEIGEVVEILNANNLVYKLFNGGTLVVFGENNIRVFEYCLKMQNEGYVSNRVYTE